MYPTVCVLMGLWGFVVAERMMWRRATTEVRRFLDNVTIADLQNRETWTQLRVLVKARPDGDVFPVRARYEEGGQHTIGLNHLSSEEPMWFTLADCVASKLLTGKAPKVIEALRFEPVGRQAGLVPINQRRSVLDGVRSHCQLTSLRRFARRAGVDPANLARVLKGGRKPSRSMLAKLQALLAEEP